MRKVSVKLTVSGDKNSPLLCGSMFEMIQTSQILPLMKGQMKLISQSGFQDFAFILWLHGCLAFGIFRKNPGEVRPDTLASAVTHSQPEGRVLLSLHRHTQQKGFWKRQQGVTGRGWAAVHVCVHATKRNISKRERTYCAQECVLFFFLVPSGSDAPPSRSNSVQNTKKTRSAQNCGLIPNHQPGLPSLTDNWCFCHRFQHARLWLLQGQHCPQSSSPSCTLRHLPTQWGSWWWCSGELRGKETLHHRKGSVSVWK